jgi:hypothetical protein
MKTLANMHMGALLFLAVCVLLPVGIGEVYGPLSGSEYHEQLWRPVNILTVVSGGIGFFVVAGEAARIFPTNVIGYKETYARNHLKRMQETLKSLPAGVCSDSPPSKYADPDFVEQCRIACPWARESADYIGKLEVGKLPELTMSLLPSFPEGITHPYLKDLFAEVQEKVSTYEELRSDFLRTENMLGQSTVEQIAVVLGPYFAAVAIGLSWFKALYGPV